MKCYCLHQVLTFLQCGETGSTDNSERIPDWPPLCAKLQLNSRISTIIPERIRLNAQHFSLIAGLCLLQLFLIVCIFLC